MHSLLTKERGVVEMKNRYEMLELEIIKFEAEDVILTSEITDDTKNEGFMDE